MTPPEHSNYLRPRIQDKFPGVWLASACRVTASQEEVTRIRTEKRGCMAGKNERNMIVPVRLSNHKNGNSSFIFIRPAALVFRRIFPAANQHIPLTVPLKAHRSLHRPKRNKQTADEERDVRPFDTVHPREPAIAASSIVQCSKSCQLIRRWC